MNFNPYAQRQPTVGSGMGLYGEQPQQTVGSGMDLDSLVRESMNPQQSAGPGNDDMFLRMMMQQQQRKAPQQSGTEGILGLLGTGLGKLT